MSEKDKSNTGKFSVPTPAPKKMSEEDYRMAAMSARRNSDPETLQKLEEDREMIAERMSHAAEKRKQLPPFFTGSWGQAVHPHH